MKKLKPCPFCGGTTFHTKRTWIYCTGCPAGVEDNTISYKKLVKAWNKRVDSKKDPDSFYQDDIDELLQAVGITNV